MISPTWCEGSYCCIFSLRLPLCKGQTGSAIRTIGNKEEIMGKKMFNRRSFLKGALAAGAAGATGVVLGGCAPQAPQTSSDSPTSDGSSVTSKSYEDLVWSFETPPEQVNDSELKETVTDDTIVIGSGVAGLMAAASLLAHGGSCTLFSAGTKPVSRGGSNHAVGTKTQARLGVDYTPETVAAHFNNEISRQGYRMDSRKWWKWINESGEAMDWVTDIMEEAGYQTTLELPYNDPNGTFSIPCGAHNFYGPEIENSANDGEPLLTATLEQYILSHGGTISYNTKAEYLIRENENTGRVSAVVATNEDGDYIKYEGTKAIVMATGDFSGDPDMMAKYCNAFADYVAESAGDYDAEFQFGGLMPGDGQKMGLWIGAAWQNTTPNAPMIGWYGFPAPCSDQNHPGILLNVEGGRFVNEDTSSVYAGYAVSGQTERKVFTVWDADFAYRFDKWEALGNNMDNLGIMPETSAEKAADFEAGVQEKTYVKGDTIEEVLELLSDQGGIDVSAAQATIEKYNNDVAAGVDTQYHKCTDFLIPIQKGPFYGQYNQLGPAQFLCVLGGLRTSPACEVCDETNTPIEGLYNVGSMMGDTFGTFYNFRVPGQNLGMACITFPYLLGKELAEK